MTPSSGTIYAIGPSHGHPVKIGSTARNVQHRLRALQIGHPARLQILASAPVSTNLRAIEKTIHRFLESDRQHGEWFAVNVDQTQLEALIVRAVQWLADEESRQAAQHTARLASTTRTMTIGERITYLRTKKGWSQAELARQAHIGQSTLHAYEAGNRPAHGMSVEIAIRLAQALNVTVDYLVGVYDEREHLAARIP